MGNVIAAFIICGIVGWAVWKIFSVIFDDDHAPYEGDN